VALKEIPIYEKVKRHQMVHELNSLYKNLQSTQQQAAKLSTQESVGSQHVVAFIDAFSNLKESTVSLMVEYMNGGSLQNIVDAGGCDDHVTLANIAKQSLLGLRFLHRTDNLHRDIKPANSKFSCTFSCTHIYNTYMKWTCG
jgi:mitogen-activated protein kinase kinase 3